MAKLNEQRWAWVALLFVITARTAPAQTYTNLFDFNGNNGFSPASVVQGLDGNFYGTTYAGGVYSGGCSYGCGTVFRLTPRGELTTLHNFCAEGFPCADGDTPNGLVLASDGNFYGTAAGGGGPGIGGIIFKISPSGTFSIIYAFCMRDPECAEGGYPNAPLIQGSDGNLYGTTALGGSNDYDCFPGACGTVFKITLDGILTTLHRFSYNDGMRPDAPVVQGPDGNLYGTTDFGGQCQDGVAFKLTREGQFTLLNSFCPPAGAGPGHAGLTPATDGNFYGTTGAGGVHEQGNVFKMTPEGTLTTLHDFDDSDGNAPDNGVQQATDGNLYGTTLFGGDLTCGSGYGCGTLFQITFEGAFNILHNFEGAPSDGIFPRKLTQDTNGKLYGVTDGGGPNSCGEFNDGCGTIFSLDMGLGPFVTFVRFAGRVGQTGPILGQGFTGTTSVSINGIEADFTVIADTHIRATVPEGATTGFVKVATPRGVLTSNVPFHVIP